MEIERDKNDGLIVCDALERELREIEGSKIVKKYNDVHCFYGAPGFIIKDLESYLSNLEREAHYINEFKESIGAKRRINKEEPLVKTVILADYIKYVYCHIDSYNTVPCTIKVIRPNPSNPISNIELLAIYSISYQYMYKREEEEVAAALEAAANEDSISTDPEILSSQEPPIQGPYGIWGHSIDDLVYNGESNILIYDDFIWCDFGVGS